jgi:predicted ATP-binding protein involved in virulence
MIEATEAEPELLRIKSISVEGLFGLYDHTIPLNLEDRVTIIHGPNGVGKTMLLQWTAALLRGELSVFLDIPFRRFVVNFTGEESLRVEPTEPSAPEDDAALHLIHTDRAGEKRLRVSRRRVLYNDARLKASTTSPRPLLEVAFVTERPLPNWVFAFVRRLNVHFVEAQRLLRQRPLEDDPDLPPSRLVPTVDEYSQALHQRVREALADYASTSQSLDQSFPQRLIQHRTASLARETLKQRMAALELKRERLAVLGLLGNEDHTHPFDVGALDGLELEHLRVLSVYVEDSEAKLRTLEHLARRIEIFLDNLNGKLSNKRLSVDPKSGIVVKDYNGRQLAPAALSSGEQHEIVLLYDLLFNVRPNTLVLIDEPELSLHITWQKRFLDDLLQIAKLVGIDALVATHSPFIIGEREDLMVALEATPTTRATPP